MAYSLEIHATSFRESPVHITAAFSASLKTAQWRTYLVSTLLHMQRRAVNHFFRSRREGGERNVRFQNENVGWIEEERESRIAFLTGNNEVNG